MGKIGRCIVKAIYAMPQKRLLIGYFVGLILFFIAKSFGWDIVLNMAFIMLFVFGVLFAILFVEEVIH